ncbi:MAG: GNAT family N-acetyltransferase [Actinomycetota bacterium]
MVTGRDELAAFYRDHVAAHLYALGDLEEPYWSPSTWYRRGDAVVGLVSLPDVPGWTVYAVATRDPEATLALVGELAPTLPAGTLVTGPTGLAETVGRSRPLAWAGPHLRYHLADRGSIPATAEGVVALGAEDGDRLRALYATEPGAAFFVPAMVDDGGFVGVLDGDDDRRLVAAAGTHVLSESARCAAIGAVYTHPSHRGRGLGRAVTAGVVHRIAARVNTIGLNVSAANAPARRIYEGLGFVPILDYEECELGE